MSDVFTCPQCNGHGRTVRNIRPFGIDYDSCPNCSGGGYLNANGEPCFVDGELIALEEQTKESHENK